MIRKFTRIELATETAWSPGMTRTSKLSDFNFTPEPGMLYVTARAISSRVNANYDGWPAEELRKAYKTFTGRGVFVDHNNWDTDRSRGVILDSRLLEDRLASGHEDTWIELLIEVDSEAFPKLAQAILAGDIDAVSMGADVEYTICSVCANKAHDVREYCAHIPTMKGRTVKDASTGKEALVFEDCYGVNFFEISFVFDPADESALISDKMLYTGAASSERTASHIRRKGERVDQYRARLRKAARKEGSSMSKNKTRRVGEAIMSLPDEVDTMRQDNTCPVCGKEFDGFRCDECGYEQPPPGLAEPNTKGGDQDDAAVMADDPNNPEAPVDPNDPNAPAAGGETDPALDQMSAEPALPADPEIVSIVDDALKEIVKQRVETLLGGPKPEAVAPEEENPFVKKEDGEEEEGDEEKDEESKPKDEKSEKPKDDKKKGENPFAKKDKKKSRRSAALDDPPVLAYMGTDGKFYHADCIDRSEVNGYAYFHPERLLARAGDALCEVCRTRVAASKSASRIERVAKAWKAKNKTVTFDDLTRRAKKKSALNGDLGPRVNCPECLGAGWRADLYSDGGPCPACEESGRLDVLVLLEAAAGIRDAGDTSYAEVITGMDMWDAIDVPRIEDAAALLRAGKVSEAADLLENIALSLPAAKDITRMSSRHAATDGEDFDEDDREQIRVKRDPKRDWENWEEDWYEDGKKKASSDEIDTLNRSDAQFLLSFADDLESGKSFSDLGKRWSEVDSAVVDYVPDDAYLFIGFNDGTRDPEYDDPNDPLHEEEMADTKANRKRFADEIRAVANQVLKSVDDGMQQKLFSKKAAATPCKICNATGKCHECAGEGCELCEFEGICNICEGEGSYESNSKWRIVETSKRRVAASCPDCGGIGKAGYGDGFEVCETCGEIAREREWNSSRKTAVSIFLESGGQEFTWDYVADDPYLHDLEAGEIAVVVEIYSIDDLGDPAEALDSMSTIVFGSISDHGNLNVDPEGEAYLRDIAQELADHYVAMSKGARRKRAADPNRDQSQLFCVKCGEGLKPDIDYMGENHFRGPDGAEVCRSCSEKILRGGSKRKVAGEVWYRIETPKGEEPFDFKSEQEAMDYVMAFLSWSGTKYRIVKVRGPRKYPDGTPASKRKAADNSALADAYKTGYEDGTTACDTFGDMDIEPFEGEPKGDSPEPDRYAFQTWLREEGLTDDPDEADYLFEQYEQGFRDAVEDYRLKTSRRRVASEPQVGDQHRVVLPYSEVCVWMNVAGKEMLTEYVGDNMVQILNEDGSRFSSPITTTEAGWVSQSLARRRAKRKSASITRVYKTKSGLWMHGPTYEKQPFEEENMLYAGCVDEAYSSMIGGMSDGEGSGLPTDVSVYQFSLTNEVPPAGTLCYWCGKSMETQTVSKRAGNGPQGHWCRFCGEYLSTRNAAEIKKMWDHMATHPDGTPEVKGHPFTGPDSVGLRAAAESDHITFECMECGKVFRRMNIPDDGEVTCPGCHSTDIEIGRNAHVHTAHCGEKGCPCEFCGKECGGKCAMAQNKKATLSDPHFSDAFTCSVCREQFSIEYSVVAGNEILCPECASIDWESTRLYNIGLGLVPDDNARAAKRKRFALSRRTATSDYYHYPLSAGGWIGMSVDAVNDLSGSGSKDEAAAYWADIIDFVDATPDQVRAHLKEMGAWDADELADDEMNKQRLVWIAAGDIAENADFFRASSRRTAKIGPCSLCGGSGCKTCGATGIVAVGSVRIVASEWLVCHVCGKELTHWLHRVNHYKKNHPGVDWKTEDMTPSMSADDLERAASRRSAKGDPYWFTAAHDGTDSKGNDYEAGDRLFYYPVTKTTLSGEAAEEAARDFASAVFDEEF